MKEKFTEECRSEKIIKVYDPKVKLRDFELIDNNKGLSSLQISIK
jgi:hypothetical protein